MPAMGTNLVGADGSVTPQMMAYYGRRARGGAGLIIVESSTVDFPYGAAAAGDPRLDEDRFVPGLAQLAEAIKNGGAVAAIQPNHRGKSREGQMGPAGMSEDELILITEKFSLAAMRVKEAGFDAVELHCAHSYLLARFLSPAYNTRNDRYGGSLENRLRFPLQVIQKVREAVGSFPILVRINGKEFLDSGIGLEESREIAQALEEGSVDAIDVSCGPGKTRYSLGSWMMPEGWRIPYAEDIKNCVSIPVIGGGCIVRTEFAATAIQEKRIDFVAVGRGMIADPEWAEKSVRGRRIRPCIGCNACVKRRVFANLPIRCAVNPEVGWEWKLEGQSQKAEAAKRVLIIGGGPAGITTALVAQRQGHKVTLREAKSRLGGQALLAALPPGKEKIGEWLQYLQEEVHCSDIKVQLDMPEGEAPEKSDYDVLVLATGAERQVPTSACSDKGPEVEIMTAEECFDHIDEMSGRHITIIGGGEVGCEISLFLVEAGATVTLIEMLDDVATDIDQVTQETLKDVMIQAGIQIKSAKVFEAVRGRRVIVTGKSGEESIETDTVVFCAGATPHLPSWIQGNSAFAQSNVIGDANGPSNILNSTTQGYWLGMRL